MKITCWALAGCVMAAAAIAPVLADEDRAEEDGASPLSLCRELTFDGADYVACAFDASIDKIKLFHTGADAKPYGHFVALKEALADRGEALVFAMNAGMFHENRMPVGLYVEGGAKHIAANTNDGPGNFHLKPNGVFWISSYDGFQSADVSTIEDYIEISHGVRYATQSGPMLVIDGEIHPKFLPQSTSRKRRNGVGVTADGRQVVFVISDSVVTFHQFARLFRDELKTPDALFLDGSISRLYAPELGRNDPGVRMGPIVGVTISTGSP